MKRTPGAVVVTFAGTLACAAADDPFSGIQRLPDPGVTPAQLTYTFDRIGERFDLLFAAAGDETMDHALAFAAEKLAETEHMVRAGEAGFAWIAAGLYKDYINRAWLACLDEGAPGFGRRRTLYAKALLEHLHHVAGVYPGLPLEVRAFAYKPLVSDVLFHYDAVDALLAEGDRETLAPRAVLMRREVRTMWAADTAGVGPARDGR